MIPGSRFGRTGLQLMAKTFVLRMPLAKVKSFVEAPMEAAESCEECRQCVDRCPYRLDVQVLPTKQPGFWDRYLTTGSLGVRAPDRSRSGCLVGAAALGPEPGDIAGNRS